MKHFRELCRKRTQIIGREHIPWIPKTNLRNDEIRLDDLLSRHRVSFFAACDFLYDQHEQPNSFDTLLNDSITRIEQCIVGPEIPQLLQDARIALLQRDADKLDHCLTALEANLLPEKYENSVPTL